MSKGSFVISLDFELYWGLIDWRSLASYADHLRGVRPAVAGMLELFREFDVHATWATVGFLFMDGMDELRARRPAVLPAYANPALDPFAYAERVGVTVPRDLHFAPDVIERILATPGQELATHTLSHFYCLEPPGNVAAFRSDLECALATAQERFGATLRSLVFPRNQYSPAHIQVAGELGIVAYRGNPTGWMHTTRARSDDTSRARITRLADTYLPITGDVTFVPVRPAAGGPVDVTASRFLRPWTRGLRAVDRLRVGRVRGDLRFAAERGRTYHLWWHPHNFGLDPARNLAALRVILEDFARLRATHGIESRSMREIADGVLEGAAS
jgi:peptidoglycan/xylan/chitin deacetylase (PgdA/CDA1 family)